MSEKAIRTESAVGCNVVLSSLRVCQGFVSGTVRKFRTDVVAGHQHRGWSPSAVGVGAAWSFLGEKLEQLYCGGCKKKPCYDWETVFEAAELPIVDGGEVRLTLP